MSHCPICKRRIPDDALDAPLPFCNQRCKLVDLGAWLSGRYVVSDALPWGEDEELLASMDQVNADQVKADESDE